MIRIADPNDFAAIVLDMRQILRLTQSEFADEIDAYPSQVHYWETGQRKPDLKSLAKLARGLGYDLALVPREDA
jgi:transcriptional regulator with XRE-family HTH domain